jgi:hypothetical protein
MTAAVQILLVPIPVAGSAFPRVTQHRPVREHKSPVNWPLTQQIPNADTRRMLDAARRQLDASKNLAPSDVF